MLRHLRVTNFAILSDVSIELGEGFNVLTGETGAGKSLIVEAVNLLRGGRASANIPRAGADEAVVEAIFELTEYSRDGVVALLADAGLPPTDDELLVRRVIHKGGRSRTYINGALTTATRLAQLGGLLVDLSGQHQHQGLVDAKTHRRILDSFAGNQELIEQMHEAAQLLSERRSRLRSLESDMGDRSERVEYLRFQLDELSEAKLIPGEVQELETERARLASVDKLQAGASECESLLYGGDGSAVDRLHQAARSLEGVTRLDESLASCAQLVNEARTLAEEAARTIERYAANLDADPARLAEVDDRLALIRKLCRKHGGSVEELLERVQGLEAELHDLDHRDENLAKQQAEVKAAEAAANKIATSLHKRRKKAASTLEGEVTPALVELGMGAAQLIVHLEAIDVGSEGSDRVEFLLAANPGEIAKPLSRVASGGELSRIMLALKMILRRADNVATYVFDEVDTGIGGGTAEVVGQQIRQVANERQVLCVTHLPQIAAFGDLHFHVSKTHSEGRTETLVKRLTDKQRAEEIARMVGGVKVSAQAKAHAKAMLEAAAAAR